MLWFMCHINQYILYSVSVAKEQFEKARYVDRQGIYFIVFF